MFVTDVIPAMTSRSMCRGPRIIRTLVPYTFFFFVFFFFFFFFFFFQAGDGIRDSVASRGLGDVYKGQFVHIDRPGTKVAVVVAGIRVAVGDCRLVAVFVSSCHCQRVPAERDADPTVFTLSLIHI